LNLPAVLRIVSKSDIRFRIFEFLCNQRYNPDELVHMLRISRQAVDQHIKLLLKAGLLLKTQGDDGKVYYEAVEDAKKFLVGAKQAYTNSFKLEVGEKGSETPRKMAVAEEPVLTPTTPTQEVRRIGMTIGRTLMTQLPPFLKKYFPHTVSLVFVVIALQGFLDGITKPSSTAWAAGFLWLVVFLAIATYGFIFLRYLRDRVLGWK